MPAGDEAACVPIDPDVDDVGPVRDVGTSASPRRKLVRGPQMALIGALGVGGAFGAVTRYAIGLAIPTPANGFPWGTLVINVSGSAVLGFVLIFFIERLPRRRMTRMVIGTGFIGAYTTFSTFTVEAVVLVRNGHASVAAVYLGTTVVVGLIAAWLGMATARVLIRARTVTDSEP
ncbi:MAG: fluoride efflux transporter CrcB [Acidimicrobiales bacterium]